MQQLHTDAVVLTLLLLLPHLLLLLLPPPTAAAAAVQARGKYIINGDIMKQLRKDAVVLHPLPRVDEVGVSALFYVIGPMYLRPAPCAVCVYLAPSISETRAAITFRKSTRCALSV